MCAHARTQTQADTHKGYGFFSEGDDYNGVGLLLRLDEGELPALTQTATQMEKSSRKSDSGRRILNIKLFNSGRGVGHLYYASDRINAQGVQVKPQLLHVSSIKAREEKQQRKASLIMIDAQHILQ